MAGERPLILTYGVAISLGAALLTAGGAYYKLEALEVRATATETRLKALEETDQATALRLARFDFALEQLTKATEGLTQEVRQLRDVRLAGGRR